MIPQNQTTQPEAQFILYKDVKSRISINVRFENRDVWLMQTQIAAMYGVTRENISQHIRNIYQTAELQPRRTSKKFLLVQTEGVRTVQRNIAHYNMDMIIAVGYRVKSLAATQFRRWVAKRCTQVIIEKKQRKVLAVKK